MVDRFEVTIQRRREDTAGIDWSLRAELVKLAVKI